MGKLARSAGMVIGIAGCCAMYIGYRWIQQPPTTVVCDRQSTHCTFVEPWGFWGVQNQWVPIADLTGSQMVQGSRQYLYQWRVHRSDGFEDIALTDWLDQREGISAIENKAIALDQFLKNSSPPTFEAEIENVTPGLPIIAAGGLVALLGGLLWWRKRAGATHKA